jgi:hypothetical protein
MPKLILSLMVTEEENQHTKDLGYKDFVQWADRHVDKIILDELYNQVGWLSDKKEIILTHLPTDIAIKMLEAYEQGEPYQTFRPDKIRRVAEQFIKDDHTLVARAKYGKLVQLTADELRST